MILSNKSVSAFWATPALLLSITEAGTEVGVIWIYDLFINLMDERLVKYERHFPVLAEKTHQI